MKKICWIALILLIALPAHAKVVSRSVEYKHGDVVLQATCPRRLQDGKRPGFSLCMSGGA